MPSSNINSQPAPPVTSPLGVSPHGISPLLISMGDPAGIGAEIVMEAWRQAKALNLPAFAYICDPSMISQVPSRIVKKLSDAADVFPEALPLIPVKLDTPAVEGRPNKANAGAALEALQLATQLCLKGDASGMVTAPVAKDQLYSAGFKAPGQTEFLADECNVARDETVMMLAGPSLRVVPVTIHVPLKDVPEHLTQALVLSRARTTHRALIQDFGIEAPRLALCGLNPHAGENAAIGTEDRDIIAPAIAQLQSEGIDARGPFSADTLFHEEARSGYDAALAMYHDQGLIPIKTLHFFDGVNATLGLPIVRTSPDHGTAFDIAGTGAADARSMIAAIQLAGQIASMRKRATPHG